MRNLKRALSLALASIMLLGMMVVGSSAAGIDDFSDNADIVNQDAVAVTSAIGMFAGYEDGTFKPENVVTRAEMAVIISTMLYGAGVNVAQFAETTVFTDVPAWATGYVNLCNSLGIVAGVGDGKFDPNATVTTSQAVLMLCRALGYFQNSSDFGNDWMLAATAKGTQLGLYGDLQLSATAGLTRDNVAELVFNALTKCVPVQYNELLGVYYNENQGITYSLSFNYLETLAYRNFNLVYDNNTQTVYGRPATTWGTGSYRTTTSQSTTGTTANEYLDANGGLLSSRVRMLDKDEIITVANDPTYVYTDGTDEDDVYADLGRSVCTELNAAGNNDGYTWTIFVNGEQVYNDRQAVANTIFQPAQNNGVDENYVPTNRVSRDYQFTGKGAVTEIYVDDADQTVTVVEVNYYLGEVADVRSDSNGEYVTVRALSNLATDSTRLDDRDFHVEGFEDEDLVVFTIDQDEDDDFYIAELMAPDSVEGTVTRVQNDVNSDNTYIRLSDDTRYNYSSNKGHLVYDLENLNVAQHPELEEDYVLYMDPNGYVLGFERAGDKTTRYLYVQDSDEELTDWAARVILSDGTSVRASVDSDITGITGRDDVSWLDATEFGRFASSDGIKTGISLGVATPTSNVDLTWLDTAELTASYDARTKVTNIDYGVWSYSVDSNGDYTLSNTTTRYMEGVEINNGRAYIETNTSQNDILVDRNTVFVDVEGKVAYTGYTEVPNAEDADIAYVVDRDGLAEVVFIINGTIYDADESYFVLSSTSRESFLHAGKNYWQYTNAYVDGVRQTIYVSYEAVDALLGAGSHLERGVLYTIRGTVDENYITELDRPSTVPQTVRTVGADAFWLTTNNVNSNKWDTDEDTVFVMVESNYNRDGSFNSYTISPANVRDMFVGTNADGYVTRVQVVANDGNTAKLVYIWKAIPTQTYDVTANFTNATVTAKVGEANAVNMTSGTGMAIDARSKVVLTVSAASGYTVTGVTVNGTAVSLMGGQFEIASLTADTTVNVTTERTLNSFTLRLEGDLGVTTPATVWTDANTQITGTPVSEFDDVVARVFEIPEGSTVIIRDANITASGPVAVGTGIGASSAGVLTFEMTEDVTLTDAPTSALIAIHYTEGMTVTAGTPSNVVLNDTDANILYLSNSSTVTATFDATLGAAYAALTSDAAISVTNTNQLNSGSVTGALSAETWLKPVAQITLNNVTVTGVTSTDWVVVGTNLTDLSAGSSGTGVIVGTTFGPAVTSLQMRATATTLSAASMLTLNDGITATLSGVNVPSGSYVAVGATPTITVPSTAGTTALNLVGTVRHVTAAANAVISGNDFTTTAANANLYAGVSVTGISGGEVTYLANNGYNLTISDSNVAGYVRSYTDVTVVGADADADVVDPSGVTNFQILQTGVSGGTLPMASCTLGVTDVTFTQS